MPLPYPTIAGINPIAGGRVSGLVARMWVSIYIARPLVASYKRAARVSVLWPKVPSPIDPPPGGVERWGGSIKYNGTLDSNNMGCSVGDSGSISYGVSEIYYGIVPNGENRIS